MGYFGWCQMSVCTYRDNKMFEYLFDEPGPTPNYYYDLKE